MATRRMISAELSAKRREAGRRGAMARWGHDGKSVANHGNGQPKRAKGSHRRRLDDYAASIIDRAAAGRLRPSDLRNVKLPWYSIVDQADEATVFIYDEIGGTFGVDAQTFAEDLGEIDAKLINVRINSPGGSLFDGIAIYNSLLAHQARIVVYVDALAASIASVIAMAGDEVVMTSGSQMMIHDALGIEMGNAADMARMSTFLDRQSANIADIYAERAGGDPADWRALMLDETWMFGREAVELGLADRVAERQRDDPDGPDDADDDLDAELRDLMSRTFNVADRYRYGGRDAAPPPLLVLNRARARPPRRIPEPVNQQLEPAPAEPEATPGPPDPAETEEFAFDPADFHLRMEAAVQNAPALPDNPPPDPEPALFQYDPERFRRSVMEALK